MGVIPAKCLQRPSVDCQTSDSSCAECGTQTLEEENYGLNDESDVFFGCVEAEREQLFTGHRLLSTIPAIALDAIGVGAASPRALPVLCSSACSDGGWQPCEATQDSDCDVQVWAIGENNFPQVDKLVNSMPVVADAPMPVKDLMGMPEGVPLTQGVEMLSPELIRSLVKDGTCLLIDVRGGDRAAGIIIGSVHIPAISVREPFAARLPDLVRKYQGSRLIVFFCQFCKHRAPFCANLFREATNAEGNTMQRVAIMEGGFRGWQKLGMPVENEGAASEQAFADAFARHQGFLIKAAPVQ